MRKIANGDGEIIVGMTIPEFERISGSDHGDIALGESVSLASIKNKLDLIDAKQAELSQLKTLSASVVSKLTEIGV